MCKSHNPRKKDKCIQYLCSYLEQAGIKVLASCCGHGRYPMTIVVEHHTNKEPLEICSLTFLERKKRFYIKDKEGYYFIPESLYLWYDKGINEYR